MASSRLRVLVVDDDPAVLRAVSRLLALTHDIVGTAANGSEGVDAARNLQPDVVVLDLNLPTLDGFSACRQMMQNNPGMRVVVFTAADAPEARRGALEAGAAAFVHKLAPVEELLSAVQGQPDRGE